MELKDRLDAGRIIGPGGCIARATCLFAADRLRFWSQHFKLEIVKGGGLLGLTVLVE